MQLGSRPFHQALYRAVLGPNGQVITPASAECRTSEITLAEFKTLRSADQAIKREGDLYKVIDVLAKQGGNPGRVLGLGCISDVLRLHGLEMML